MPLKFGIIKINQATLFSGRVTVGETFVGIGQGKSGTGKDKDEPKPIGTFRGDENTIDYIFDKDAFTHFRSDFDEGTDEYNTLERVSYGPKNLTIKGKSSKTPLPLEGTTAAGESGSGSGSRVQRNKKYHLAGIASYRYFSMFGGQAGSVNLSHPAMINWIRAVSLVENVSFEIVESRK